LEELQENGQKHQKRILQHQNPRNLKQEKRTIGTHELDQKQKLPAIEVIKYNR